MPRSVIDLADLGQLASSALERGFDFLLTSTLPSSWHAAGRGWQEQWKADFAGFYASCDGVLLLNTCSIAKQRSNVDTLLESIFSQHLCRIVDPEVSGLSLKQQDMRDTCLGTTTKLAKFLQASTKENPLQHRHRGLIESIRDKIIGCGKRNRGAWPANIDSTDPPTLSATCESLIALSESYSSDIFDLIQEGAHFLLSNVNFTTNKKWRLASFWALSEIAKNLSSKNLDELSRQQISIIPLLAELDDDCITDTFNNSLGRGDYYHLNARLLGAKSILRLHSLGISRSDYLHLSVPIVQYAADKICEHGRFIEDGNNIGARFWEHYQAMTLLDTYISFLADNPSTARKVYMLISPRHFEDKNFITQPDLAVALMPFRPHWSMDVFDSFKKATTKNGISCWRSDLRFRDDRVVQSIWEEINKSRFVIADCTGQNPNVFYELGIAHTIGKPVFICAQNRKDIPFDLSAIRSFEYGEATPSNLKLLQTALHKFISAL